MIDPTNANAGLFFVVIATAIATILTGFIIVALIARFGFKIRINISSFIAASTLSVLFFIAIGALGPVEAKSTVPVVQLYSLFLLIGTVVVNFVLLKLFQPKNIEALITTEYKKSTAECQEHYKAILKELRAIEKLRISQELKTPSKFKQIFKFGNKGNRNVKS